MSYARHSGVRSLQAIREPGISIWLSASGFPATPTGVAEVRDTPPAASPRARNDSVGRQDSTHTFFPISVDNIPIWIIVSSILPHREGRSRSSRSRGGMRWRRRCGVTGDVGDGCLRAGRIVCGQDTTGTGGTVCLWLATTCRSRDGRPHPRCSVLC